MKKILLVIIIVAGVSFVTASKEESVNPSEKALAAESSSMPIPVTKNVHQQVFAAWD